MMGDPHLPHPQGDLLVGFFKLGAPISSYLIWGRTVQMTELVEGLDNVYCLCPSQHKTADKATVVITNCKKSLLHPLLCDSLTYHKQPNPSV